MTTPRPGVAAARNHRVCSPRLRRPPQSCCTSPTTTSSSHRRGRPPGTTSEAALVPLLGHRRRRVRRLPLRARPGRPAGRSSPWSSPSSPSSAGSSSRGTTCSLWGSSATTTSPGWSPALAGVVLVGLGVRRRSGVRGGAGRGRPRRDARRTVVGVLGAAVVAEVAGAVRLRPLRAAPSCARASRTPDLGADLTRT